MRWRFIDSGALISSENMSIDGAIFEAHRLGYTLPALRIYSWKKPAISFGRLQDVRKILNFDYCESQGIEVVRRPTGGRIILHENDFSYSFIISRKFGMPSSILKSYRLVCSALIDALKSFGIKTEFASGGHFKHEICLGSLNDADIVYKGRKFAGNAQFWKEGTLLHQGTITLDLNLNLFKSLLNLNSLESKDIDERIVSLSQEIISLTRDSLKEALIKSFAQTFKVEFSKEELSDWEVNRSFVLNNFKYRSSEWTLFRHFKPLEYVSNVC